MKETQTQTEKKMNEQEVLEEEQQPEIVRGDYCDIPEYDESVVCENPYR